MIPQSLFDNFLHEIVIYNGNSSTPFSYLYSRYNAKFEDDILIFTSKMANENKIEFNKLWSNEELSLTIDMT